MSWLRRDPEPKPRPPAAVTPTPDVKAPPRLAELRCDRCGVAALVVVVRGPEELQWCGHHYRKHAAPLEAGGWRIVVDRRQEVGTW